MAADTAVSPAFIASMQAKYSATYQATAEEQARGFRLIALNSAANDLSNPIIGTKGTYLFRYAMTLIPLIKPETDKTAIIMMMNPGNAGKKPGESTVSSDKALTHLYSEIGNVYKRIIIINTMPFYQAKSSRIGEQIKELEDSYGIDSETWQRGNLDTFSAYLKALADGGEIDYDVLLGTGELKPYNRSIFYSLINLLPNKIINENLYAVQLLGGGDAAYLSNPYNRFSVSRENWQHVDLVPTKIKQEQIYHLKISGASGNSTNTPSVETSSTMPVKDTQDEAEEDPWQAEQDEQLQRYEQDMKTAENDVNAYVRQIAQTAVPALLANIKEAQDEWLSNYIYMDPEDLADTGTDVLPIPRDVDVTVVINKPFEYHEDGNIEGFEWLRSPALGGYPSVYGSYLAKLLNDRYGIYSNESFNKETFHSFYAMQVNFEYGQSIYAPTNGSFYGQENIPAGANVITINMKASVSALLDPEAVSQISEQVGRKIDVLPAVKAGVLASDDFTLVGYKGKNSKYYADQKKHDNHGVAVFTTDVFDKWRKGKIETNEQKWQREQGR